LRLLEQPRFRSAFDLLALRAQLGLAPADIAAWWTRLQAVSPEERLQLLDALPRARPGPKTGNAPAGAAASLSPEVASGPAGESGPAASALEGDGASETGVRRTRRRRRRRRSSPGSA
jgi:poly(A) polymerase